MGLVYSSGESAELIQALTSNLASGKEATNQLKSGSQKIVAAVDGRTLAGAAYTAGKGLFSDLIIPTITRATTACDAIEQELQKYKSADQTISSEGYLNEDNLNQQIAIKKAMKASVEFASSVAKTASRNNPVAAVLDSLLNFQKNLNRMSDNIQDDIEQLQKKLEKLHSFSSQTSGLFNNSLNDLKIAMQGVLVLDSTIVNSDGSYTLPAGVDKSWFNSLKNTDKLKEMEEKEKNLAIKELNDLFSKNPAAALEKIKNNDRLFSYVIAALDKFPKGIQDAALNLFIMQESWNQLPKNIAKNVLNNPKFGLYVSKLSLDNQAKVYGSLLHLSDKGWDVLAPLGYVTSILSKSKAGAKVIAGSKVGLTLFKKLDPVSKFVKAHPVAREGLSYGGDTLTIIGYAYEEYTNPKSPAYGDESKALYGGINLFMWNAGPLEGAQYGGPIGALVGTANTLWQYGKYNIINNIPNLVPGEKNDLGWNKESDKREWLDNLYKDYGKHEASPTDKNYRPGVQPESGSPNFNPGTQYTPNQGNNGVSPNNSPLDNWGVK
ncbi:T7SS effector LXG polymorphic toxin [Enterococcus termitis]|uniref:T7SS effector LXG polymorphic toxin n=1 Tax=Enterococcus termitis TaxID=332950 RepID=UPI000B10D6D3|nr:T7SS effector LXG polymorphic toxin [Enterococcus termitis]